MSTSATATEAPKRRFRALPFGDPSRPRRLTKVIAWLVGSLIGSDPPPRPAATPSPVPIAGTYQTTLPGTDPQVAELGVAGTYTLTLTPNGVIQLETPSGFGEAYESASGDAYRVTGNIVVDVTKE